MGMFLAGCGANSGSAGIEEDAVMQELYDRSEIARGYTDPIFQEYLDQYDSAWSTIIFSTIFIYCNWYRTGNFGTIHLFRQI